jgi:hypothetical protein
MPRTSPTSSAIRDTFPVAGAIEKAFAKEGQKLADLGRTLAYSRSQAGVADQLLRIGKAVDGLVFRGLKTSIRKAKQKKTA